ncbi:hypothetical protein CFC21_020056 [Triticum aestivum]|uniref:Thioredoxin domain-containing protein n=2 Tax=Triticum aestivum TaxID=4565 RepID=A0A9R1E7K0_WHEAT|nr:hypothetical protein CFC21_020031 [Triticum aestivum]KAF7004888.1 hypothetical protein CFC21_020056 [Triticum aestivum]
MAHHVEHLHSAEAVDEAIFREAETKRLVIVRFGQSAHADCLRVDAAMAAAAERIGPVAVLYAVDIDEVQDFNVMYELHVRPCTVMFFYGNSCVDVRGPCCRDDIVWAAYGGDDFAGIITAVHERARAGRRLVVLG